MDPREARFLASQAERLACNKKQHRADDDFAPELVDDCNGNTNDVGSKDISNQFFSSFRRICTEFRNRLDLLLLIPSTSSSTGGDAPPPSMILQITMLQRPTTPRPLGEMKDGRN